MKYILITTECCPKCASLKRVLQEKEIEYEEIRENHEKFVEYVSKFDLREAPAMIDIDEDKVVNIEEIEMMK